MRDWASAVSEAAGLRNSPRPSRRPSNTSRRARVMLTATTAGVPESATTESTVKLARYPRLSLGPVIRRTTKIWRSEEHTSELQSLAYLVCRLLLEKKKYSFLDYYGVGVQHGTRY